MHPICSGAADLAGTQSWLLASMLRPASTVLLMLILPRLRLFAAEDFPEPLCGSEIDRRTPSVRVNDALSARSGCIKLPG